MVKNLVAVIKGSIDYNRIADAVNAAGFIAGKPRKGTMSLPAPGTMEALRISSNRFVKHVNGLFLDRYITRHDGCDYFWFPKKDQKHIDWNSGGTHAVSLKGILPSIFEFQSLKDYTKSNPCILDCAKVLELDTNDCYWTRDPYAGDSGHAWVVFFKGGGVGNYTKDAGNYVRPCRRSQ